MTKAMFNFSTRHPEAKITKEQNPILGSTTYIFDDPKAGFYDKRTIRGQKFRDYGEEAVEEEYTKSIERRFYPAE